MRTFFFWMSLLVFFLLSLTFKQPLLEKYDVAVILFFERIRTGFLNNFFHLVTQMGSIKVLLPVAIVIAVLLAVKKKYHEAFFVMLVFWGARLANSLLKEFFGRERPSFHSLVHEGSYSFPSGHTMNSTVLLGFLLYLFIYSLQIGKKYSTSWLLITIVLVVLIATSRIYLGVHYLTDVIAGGCAGLLLLFLFIYLYELTARRENSIKKAIGSNE
ncbi:phosphatase PAP2 family protein [Pseudobacillus sp. FSL P4-0506]|uniref:phosphatase PAP2 family protein n=1 Tax=unclassified Pseudobacillus TaxID=2619284 RepID=UPI0030F4E625